MNDDHAGGRSSGYALKKVAETYLENYLETRICKPQVMLEGTKPMAYTKIMLNSGVFLFTNDTERGTEMFAIPAEKVVGFYVEMP